MAKTYTPIATTTASGVSSVTFNSIPGTYTDLILVIHGLASSESYYEIQYNGDTAGNYSATYAGGTGSSTFTSRQSNVAQIPFSRIETNSMLTAHIMNYSNTTTYKTIIGTNANAGQIIMMNVGLWRNTNAITSITIKSQLVNFNTGSTFTLYGIKAA